MNVYLVRHAEFLNPNKIFPFHLPLYLSPAGRAHVHRVGDWFTSQNLTGLPIVASPIVRCVQTAEIIAAHTTSDVTLDERLIEVANPKLQGTPFPVDPWQLEETHPDTETHAGILTRTRSWMNDMIKTGGDIIGVSHGTPLTILYFSLMGQEIPAHLWSPENELKNIQRGEIAVLTFESGQLKEGKRVVV